MVRHNRVEKTLLAPDGTQLCAQLGMVDKDGAMFYVLDADKAYTIRLEHIPMSWLMADLEAETRNAKRDLEDATAAYRRQHELFGRALDLIDELLATGKFPRGMKTPYKERQWRMRNEYGRDDGQLPDGR